jgi:hypothetical protein
MSSTSTIKKQVPKFVEYHANKGNFPTKTQIYDFVKNDQIRNPWNYGKSTLESSYGTIRSFISAVTTKKENRELKNIHYFEQDGVQYFYTDIEQVFQRVKIENGCDEDVVEKPIRNHVDCQYMLADLGIYAGFETYIAHTDRYCATNFGGTIEKEFSGKLKNIPKSEDENFLDVIFYENGIPSLLIEVEESTNVIKGMERMMECKRKYPNVKSLVTSSSDSYKDKFEKYSNGTYKYLNASFCTIEKIKEIYHNVKKNGKFTTSSDKVKKMIRELFL